MIRISIRQVLQGPLPRRRRRFVRPFVYTVVWDKTQYVGTCAAVRGVVASKSLRGIAQEARQELAGLFEAYVDEQPQNLTEDAVELRAILQSHVSTRRGRKGS